MTIILFFKIVFVCLLGAMSPGPSMVVVINNSIMKDKFNGILTAIGHGTGIGIYAFFAVVGIGIIIETNIYVFNSIKFLSILFLLYMGISALLKNSNTDFNENKNSSGSRSFFQGFLISILNPKILIWFVAIYSQFMSSYNNFYLNLSLILIASIVDTLWYIFLVNMVTTKNILLKLQRKTKHLQFVIGCVFILIATTLMVDTFL